MNKRLIAAVAAILLCTSAFAQFESGKKFVGASLSGASLSYSDRKDLAFGLGAEAGYFFTDAWMLVGDFGFDYANSDLEDLWIGAKVRYYIEQNGLFLGCGVRYEHEFKSHNDFMITPEVGYCFFVNKTLVIEPAVYGNLSLADFSENTEVGVRIGLGIIF